MKRFMTLVATVALMTVPAPQKSFASSTADEMYQIVVNKSLYSCTSNDIKSHIKLLKKNKQPKLGDGFCFDGNAAFVSASRIEAQRAQSVGFDRSKYGAIPVALLDWNGDVVIAGIDKNSEAYRAGLRVGDVIDKVIVGKKDGRCRPRVEGKRNRPDAGEISRCLSGPLGTQVSVTVEGKPEIALDRVAMDATPSVFVEDNGDITYVRVTNFNKETVSELWSVFEGSRKIILDLRGNLGGDFRQVESFGVGFAKEPEEILVVQQMKDESKPISKPVTAQMVMKSPEDIGRFGDTPVAVLIDSETFSSGEILAGMLKVLRSSEQKILLFGVETYGKAQAQCWYPLSDGSYFKATCMEIRVGAEKLRIHKDKLSPDVKIEDSREYFVETTTASDVQYVTALNWLRSRPTTTTVAALAQ